MPLARNEAMNSNFGDTFVYSSPNPEEATFGVSTLKCLVRVDGGSHYYDSDVILMRYADELLMIAECDMVCAILNEPNYFSGEKLLKNFIFFFNFWPEK
jgi:hypothetical protein